MTRSRRGPWVPLVVVIALLAAPVPPSGVADAVAQEACVDVVPIASVTRGLQARGLTVARGTVPEEFSVTVLDVLQDGIAPGVPLIVVEVRSAELDRVGGIWGGMSGSPVYVGGRLLGAISYGFSFGPSRIGGVTPAAHLLQVPTRASTAAAPAATAEPRMTSELQAYAAAAEGVATTQVAAMEPLKVPVRISGPAGAKLERFAAAFERAHPGTLVVRSAGGTAATATAADIVPGGNLAVSLAYGDYTAMGLGTATIVCDGLVIGFGHPLLFDGATRLGMHAASVVGVVDDPVYAPFKLANAGPPVGTIDQDRLAGVSGRLGALPRTTAVTSTITNLDDGRTVTGRTDGVYPDDLFGTVLVHGWNNFDTRVFDDPYFAGSALVSWTIRGLRADGRRWSVTRENRHADRWDLASASLYEVASSAQLLHDNPFEAVEVTEVSYRARAGSPYQALEILPDRIAVSVAGGPPRSVVDAIELPPGSTVRLQVPVRPYRSEVRVVEIDLEVPVDAVGYGELIVGAQDQGDVWECLYYPEACGGAVTDSFDDLLADVATRPRADELTVTLQLYGDVPVPETPVEEDPVPGSPAAAPEPAARATVRLDAVVTGSAFLPVFVGGAAGVVCPVPASLVFVDVDPASPHASAVACAAALGLTQGTDAEPPRFGPAQTVRRDQAASFVAALLGDGPKPLPAGDPDRFTDLAGNVHRDAIERLAEAGIVKGRTATTYAPREDVTRAQLATLLVEAMRWGTGAPIEAETGPHFSDVGGVHAANIDAAFELGILRGRPDGTFLPGATTRRDQMASVLVRAYPLVAGG